MDQNYEMVDLLKLKKLEIDIIKKNLKLPVEIKSKLDEIKKNEEKILLKLQKIQEDDKYESEIEYEESDRDN